VVAVPTNSLATLPDEVSFAQAATLPVAGLTALYALERGGMLLERPVLITGVTGGVGYYACQLAHETGARVTAVVRRQDQIDLVQSAGADTVVVSEDAADAAAHGPYYLIVDPVGGRTLANAITMLASDGTCVTLGAAGGMETSFQALSFLRIGGATLYGLGMYYELQRQPPAGGLARLARLVAAGRLRPLIAVEEPWTEIGRVAQQLRDRRYAGKAVLHIMA
jgi:NADPH:quinone reductase-like Zn-dependent oxidoreductase